MKNDRWVIYDGRLVKAAQPVVPVESRGLMYGDGCFETLRLYEGLYFKLKEHLNRLRAGAKFLGMEYPADLKKSSLKKLVSELLQSNKLLNGDTVVRIQLWREGKRGYDDFGAGKTHYSILAASLHAISESVSLATVSNRRIPDEALPSKFKLCNNINYITAARQARQKGADDALMQTVDGYLSETTIANIFWISGNMVFTPSEKCDLLSGITREVLIDLIKRRGGVEIKEGEFGIKDILKAEAVWICNSVRELLAVSQIDGQKYNIRHPFVNTLKSDFETYLKEELTG